MQQIQALRAKRQAIARKMNDLHSKHEGKGTWGEAEQTAWDADVAELDRADAEISRIIALHERMADEASSHAPVPRGSSEIPLTVRGADGRNLYILEPRHKASALASEIAGTMGRSESDDVTIAEICAGLAGIGRGRAPVRAALQEGSDAAGGVHVPTRLELEVIDALRAKQVCVTAGARVVLLDTLKTSFAKVATDPVAGWRNENTAVAESDPTFARVEFTARSLAVLVKCPRELFDDAVNLDESLRGAFAGALATELDRVCLYGTGTAPQPRGIVNVAGIGGVLVATNGAQLTAITAYPKIMDTLFEIETDNAGPTSALIMAPRTWKTLGSLADTTNQPLASPPAVAALPRLVTTSVPINETEGTSSDCSSIIAGRFSDLWIGLRMGLRIELFRETFAANLQVCFIAHLRADVQVGHAESFARLRGIKP